MLRAMLLTWVPAAMWAGAIEKEGMGRRDVSHPLRGLRRSRSELRRSMEALGWMVSMATSLGRGLIYLKNKCFAVWGM